MSVLILLTVDNYLATGHAYTTIAFIIGSFTSIVSGYIGMRVAVHTNVRTTKECATSIGNGFVVAFRGGEVLGFTLVGMALFVLCLILIIYKNMFLTGTSDIDRVRELFEMIAGYGLGGSTVALFGRVGGGIYTKAADVGSDLAGKVIFKLNEDDEKNPGVIADNVGDNVGDIAGMGADLFGSLAESTCAALVVSASSKDLIFGVSGFSGSLYFPLIITSVGILVCFITQFAATHFATVTE
jgi:H+-translocating diphosphatase